MRWRRNTVAVHSGIRGWMYRVRLLPGKPMAHHVYYGRGLGVSLAIPPGRQICGADQPLI